jgi:hypothetical protein
VLGYNVKEIDYDLRDGPVSSSIRQNGGALLKSGVDTHSGAHLVSFGGLGNALVLEA